MLPLLRDNLAVRPAEEGDYHLLANFLHYERHIHRHLDWRAPLEWLGSQPFLLAEVGEKPVGVLACPPDPPGIAWVRLFCASEDRISPSLAWAALLEGAKALLAAQTGQLLAAIALNDWFEDLLIGSGFEHPQNIVVLEWRGNLPQGRPVSAGVSIRKMALADLPAVEEVDRLAFHPLWRNSLDALTLAYSQSALSTVAETSQGIVGYQISTSVPLSGHLARLAVHPDAQRQNIGHALVHDLLTYFKREGAWRVTVNTQSDNYASLSLYEKIGFVRTDGAFPVYQAPV